MVGLCFTVFRVVRGAQPVEKTVWTWSRGAQMVGFSLWHIPLFAVVGTLCSLAVALWLLLATPYVIARRHAFRWDLLMMACAAFVIAALAVPSIFFA